MKLGVKGFPRENNEITLSYKKGKAQLRRCSEKASRAMEKGSITERNRVAALTAENDMVAVLLNFSSLSPGLEILQD